MHNTQENNLIITEKNSGLPEVITPYSIKFDVVTGNSLFNRILEESNFTQLIEKELNSTIPEYENYTEAYKKKLQNRLDLYKEALKESKVKMSIKIELEKDE